MLAYVRNPSSLTSACKSSSKISCFLSAKSLKRAKAAFRASSLPVRCPIPASAHGTRHARVLAHHHLVSRPAYILGAHDLVSLAMFQAYRPDGCQTRARSIRAGRWPCSAAPGSRGDADTSLEDATICVVSMRVSQVNMSRRVFTAITTSSSAAFPARSPRPLMVHSTWRAPFITAANELAEAMPDRVAMRGQITLSLCRHAGDQLLEALAPQNGSCSPRYPATFSVLAPAWITASNTRTRKSISERTASSAENSTSSVYSSAHFHRLHRALHHLIFAHAQLVLHVYGRSGDEGMDAPGLAGLIASPAARNSFSLARASEHTVARSMGFGDAQDRVGIARGWRRRSRARSRPRRVFPAGARCGSFLPWSSTRAGLCSPSRKVVSNIINLSSHAWVCHICAPLQNRFNLRN